MLDVADALFVVSLTVGPLAFVLLVGALAILRYWRVLALHVGLAALLCGFVPFALGWKRTDGQAIFYYVPAFTVVSVVSAVAWFLQARRRRSRSASERIGPDART